MLRSVLPGTGGEHSGQPRVVAFLLFWDLSPLGAQSLGRAHTGSGCSYWWARLPRAGILTPRALPRLPCSSVVLLPSVDRGSHLLSTAGTALAPPVSIIVAFTGVCNRMCAAIAVEEAWRCYDLANGTGERA